ncbi:MAG: restriction endonuclease subunit S [Giesbergeria sp.]
MSFPSVSVRDVVEAKTGTKNPAATSDKEFIYVDVAAVDNEAKAITGQRSLLGSEAPSRARKLIRQGDVLVSTVRPNLNAVALVPASLDGAVASTGFCVLRANSRALPEYLLYFVRSRGFVESLCTLVAGAMYPAVSDSQVLDQQLPLPPLPEQRRIVDLLSRAEGIVRLRREAEKKAAELIPALFNDMFGDPATNPKGWPLETLESAAKIISGATKGRRFDPSEAVELPYMRVANVKDGYLDLAEIKTIAVKRGEIEKYRLLPGDLLLTEGGDPDKLGRGALWAGEIETCLHQNHIYKVRADRSKVLPEYLCELVGSRYGKAYFLQVAKKTTGIATINRTQLGRFPVVVPPLSRQVDFCEKLSGIRSIQSQQSTATAKAQATFDALLADAFKDA